MSQHHDLLESLSGPVPSAVVPAPPGTGDLGLTSYAGLATSSATAPAGILAGGAEMDFLGGGGLELSTDLGDGLSWEKLLSQLEEPQSALGEIRQFADQWWGFCQSRHSAVRRVRRLLAPS